MYSYSAPRTEDKSLIYGAQILLEILVTPTIVYGAQIWEPVLIQQQIQR